MVDVLKKVLVGGGAVVACVMCGSTFGMDLKSQLGIGNGLDEYKRILPGFKKAPSDIRLSYRGKCVFAIDANTVIFDVQKIKDRDFVKTNQDGAPVFSKFEFSYKIVSKLGKVTAKLKVTDINGTLQNKSLYGVFFKSLENNHADLIWKNKEVEVVIGAQGVQLGGFINKKDVTKGVDMVQENEDVGKFLTTNGYNIPENKNFDIGAEFKVSVSLKAD